jgi:hypothetical protein
MSDPQRIAKARNQVTQGALKYDNLLPTTAQSLANTPSAIFNDPDRLQQDFPVPICQCVQIKQLGTPGDGNPERFRIVLSDIKNFVQSMLATRQ